MIVYLHGFRSSPHSFKARELGRADQFICPQLPASPREAIALVQGLIAPYPARDVALIGSSLGGYYATWLAEQGGHRAALLNPATTPLRNLDQHVGQTTAYHSDEPFLFKQEYLAELDALAVPVTTDPARYYLMAGSADEVLDHRDMLRHYPGARTRLIDGADHALAQFADHVDEVLAFCGVQGQAR